MRDILDDEVDLQLFCDHFNEIIEQAIIHGGDTGGAYCCNEEELLKVISRFLSWMGLDEYLTIYKDDFPKLLVKNKIEKNEE